MPDTLKMRGKALERVLAALVKRGLAAETHVRSETATWRRDDDVCIGVVATAAGLAAIGVDDSEADSSGGQADAKPAEARTAAITRPGGKLGKILAAVEADEGATIGELARSAAWQPHTTPRCADTASPARLRYSPRDGRRAQGLPAAVSRLRRCSTIEAGGQKRGRRIGGRAARRGPSLPVRLAALADMPVPMLKKAWTAAWSAPPPKGARRRFLMLGIAWRRQALAHGGFTRSLERRLAGLEATIRQGRRITPDYVKAPPRLMPGSRLVRVWRGERHEVHVTEAGYIWLGATHASLSAVARAIVGTRRNGPAFFGLRDRGRGS